MTISIAITGKSGSGKTTVLKALLKNLKEQNPGKSFLLVDNDLSCELGHSFGHDVRDTVYGIRSGKHEYKTGIPSQMTRQEYIEWALQDIIFELDEDIDLLVTWLVGSKDCRCPITSQINDALLRLFKGYDFIIFDCEFDLKYLYQLVDYHIDATMIVAEATDESLHLASRVMESSEKYAVGGQLGLVINKAKNGSLSEHVITLLNKYDLNLLGVLPYDTQLETNGVRKDSDLLNESIKEILFRLNLPKAK